MVLLVVTVYRCSIEVHCASRSINTRVFPSITLKHLELQSINSKQPYPVIPFNTVAYTCTPVRRIWQISLSNKNACIRTYDGFSRRFLHVSVLDMNPVLSNLLLDFLKITTTHSQFISQIKPWPNGLASSRNLNLRGDLRWVDERTRKHTQVAEKKTHHKATGLVFHWLIGCYNNKWTTLNLRWPKFRGQSVKDLRRLARCKSDLDLSERKSSRVDPSFFNFCLLASPFGHAGITYKNLIGGN